MMVVPGSAFLPYVAQCDPFWSDCVLLCHFNGDNLSSTVIDEIGHTVTKVSGIPSLVLSTTKKIAGTASLVGNGDTGTYYTTDADGDFALIGDFTVEAFCYMGASSNNNTIVEFSNGWRFFFSTGVGSGPKFYAGSTYGNDSIPVPTDAWVHVAFSRSSNTLRAFVDGALAWSLTFSTDDINDLAVRIGGGTSFANTINCYMDELRITMAARYTDAFEVPSVPFAGCN